VTAEEFLNEDEHQFALTGLFETEIEERNTRPVFFEHFENSVNDASGDINPIPNQSSPAPKKKRFKLVN